MLISSIGLGGLPLHYLLDWKALELRRLPSWIHKHLSAHLPISLPLDTRHQPDKLPLIEHDIVRGFQRQ